VLAYHAGFAVAEIPVNHRPREHGSSKYGLERLVRGPIDLATVLFLGRFRYRPLHFFGLIGSLLGVVGVGIAIHLSWLRLVRHEASGERPLLLFAVLLILAGIQLFSVGLLGEMVLAFWRPRSSLYRPIGPSRY
jgi:hypothetical protein